MARQAVLEILADASKLKSNLKDAEGSANKFGTGMGKALAVVGGTAAITAFGMSSVKAFTESAQATSKLELALKNNSLTVGVHASDFEKLNRELAKHTLVDDDVIAATEAQMVTFGMSKKQIESMIPTVLDLAAKMGIDAPAAADLFDKASLGSVKALKTLGIEGYKPTGDKANDLANIQGLLADKVKGAAQAQLDAAGPGAKMQKSMDELKETVGSFLVPALQKMADVGVKITDFLAEHPVVTKFAIAAGGLAGAVWAVNAATGAWAAAQTALNSQLLLTLARLTAILGPLAIVVGGINEIKNTEGGLAQKVLGDSAVSRFIGKIPGLASGGPINGLRLVGERGPELFAGRGTIIPNNALGGAPTTNNITVSVPAAAADPLLIGRAIAWEL